MFRLEFVLLHLQFYSLISVTMFVVFCVIPMFAVNKPKISLMRHVC